MKSLVCAITLICATQIHATEKGFLSLFDGKNLTGWQGIGGKPSNWIIENGVLSCTGKEGSQWLATKRKFSNFDLRLEYKIPKNGNSGVFIRAPKEGSPWITGMEIQILDDYGLKWKDLKPDQFTGSIYAVVAPSKRVTKNAGEWQTMRILCIGTKCRVWINSKQVIKVNLTKLKKHTERLKRSNGYIGLQNHSSPVFYRNIRLKELSS